MNKIYIKNLFKYRCLFPVVKFFFDKDIRKTTLSKKIKQDKKIVIYGFGPYGEQCFLDFFYSQEIVGILDIKYKKLPHYIKNPELVNSLKYDYIIVTVMDESAKKEVINFLLERKVFSEKIVLLEYV